MLESLVHEVEAADQELTRLRNKIQSRLIFLLLVTFKKLSRIRKIKPHMIGFLFIILKIADKKSHRRHRKASDNVLFCMLLKQRDTF